jgi:DNA ligase (NAD+)
MRRLIDLEKEHPEFFDPNSPSQRVGVILPAGIKGIKHRVKMLSLDNTYSIEELKDWHQRVVKGLGTNDVIYNVELKIDGVSISLSYVDGDLKMGATRGDGVTGEDVTHAVRTIRSVPLKLKNTPGFPVPHILEVRGEVYMRLSDFHRLNKGRKDKGQEIFANPRNATSGSLKLLDSRITAGRRLNCFIHSFGVVEGGYLPKTQNGFLATMRKWGFTVNEHNRVCNGINEVVDFCNEFAGKRNDLEYEVDGVVIKVNDLPRQEKLGTTLKSPRWAVAYKFAAQQATTLVNKITVQVGRTGILTPVAELEPVECAGVTISRATLHNFDEVKRLDIAEGDRVLIERAGDVIPKVVKVVEHAKGKKGAFDPPKVCPECGSPITKLDLEEVAYRCQNPSCPKQLERRVIHFTSRGAMDIDGFGEAVVKQLLDQKKIHDIADIYFLNREDLLSLELFKDKKADNLLKAIEKSRSQPLERLIFGLGIANIGEKAAAVLANNFGTMNKLMQAGHEELASLNDFGKVTADSVVSFFRKKEVRGLIEKLEDAGINLEQPRVVSASNKFQGMKFVFTGELANMTRDEAEGLVKKMGGEAASSVSKKTSFVVAGDNAGSKYDKARQLRVPIINEQKFQEMVNEP